MSMAMTSDIMTTIGLLLLIPLLIVSCIHYRDCAAHTNGIDIDYDIDRSGEEKAVVATLFVGADDNDDDADHPQDDYENDDDNGDADADDYDVDDNEVADGPVVIRQEIVEITFDLGYLEDNINGFRSRIHRIII